MQRSSEDPGDEADGVPGSSLPDPVLIVGGSGRTGCQLAERLVPHVGVRVLARDAVRARERLPDDCEVCEGSVLRRPTLKAALEGVACVVLMNAGDATWQNRPELVDVLGTRHLLEQMDPEAAVLLVSSIAVTRPEHAFDTDPFSLAWKAGGEELVRMSSRRYAIVRPGWLVDGKRRPGIRLGQGDVLDGRLSRNALAEVCLQMLRCEEVWGKTFEVVEGTDPWPVDWCSDFAELESDMEVSTKTLKARGAEVSEI
ncbi:MAG: NAD(P)H-binding protein [Nocardioidaceae bacterium]